MLYSPSDFAFSCSCGKKHEVTIRRVVIEPGAMHALTQHMSELGLLGRIVAIYDENTYAATVNRHPAVSQEIVLDPNGLHANENATAAVLQRLKKPDVLIAIGSGTIHDTTRYCAAKLGIPFVSVPTAASVDGFASSVAAMTWEGFKVTLPAVAPTLIVADTEVIAHAPLRLTRSGVGDLLGKYICLTDWKLGHLLTGEYFCDGIEAMTRRAVDAAVESCNGLLTGDLAAYEKLTYGLILSGIAMQLSGNSRPASGAEHHVSHMIELGVFGPNAALHGEKVGVGTLLCAELYECFAEMSANEVHDRLLPYHALEHDLLFPVFGELTESALKENTDDCLAAVPPQRLEERWDELCALLREIPSRASLSRVMESLGAKQTLADIDVSRDNRTRIAYWSPLVRNRLTLLRVAHLLFVDEAAIGEWIN